MNATTPQGPKAARSPEAINRQIETLQSDLMKLAAKVTDEMSDGVERAGRQIGRTGRDARAAAKGAVLDHPLAALGIAAGLGLLLGLVARRG